MRPDSVLVAAYLVLGVADCMYLDLVAAPSVLGKPRAVAVVVDDTPAARRAHSAARPARIAAEAGPPAAGQGRSARAVPARALDPELSARTGAEPQAEPERAVESKRAVEPERAVESKRGRTPGRGEVAAPAGGRDALRSEPIRIQFARDRSILSERAKAQLERVAGSLSSDPDLRAAIDGHADRQGETDYNDELSRDRAESVADYFAARGIDRARISVRAFGERKPLDTGPGPEANRRNRRVEIRLSR